MIAFWKYNQFPFLLSGTVTGFNCDTPNRVQTMEFGRGSWFVPEFILSDEQGKALQSKLKALQEEYEAELVRVKKEYEKRLYKIVGTVYCEPATISTYSAVTKILERIERAGWLITNIARIVDKGGYSLEQAEFVGVPGMAARITLAASKVCSANGLCRLDVYSGDSRSWLVVDPTSEMRAVSADVKLQHLL